MAVKIGVLHDMPGMVPGSVLERAARLGVEDVRATPSGATLPDVDLVVVEAAAHPVGKPEVAVDALLNLAADGVVAVIGPAVSDNALVCQPVADELTLPCINWSGSERTRSDWMFHYQVGSLEDEPYVIAEHLARRGWERVVVVREDSIIGRHYVSFFEDAALVHALQILDIADLDLRGANVGEVANTIDRLAPDAVAYFGFPSAGAFAAGMTARSIPVAGNSALMGIGRTDLAEAVEDWCYIDVFDEANVQLQRFEELWSDAASVGPAAVFDMARLVALGLAHAPSPDRAGVRAGLERVKRIPATIGEPGTIAGFGQWKRNALEGGYLVLRQWRNGQSVRAFFDD